MKIVVDIALLAIIAMCTWSGYKRGLIGGVASILAIVIAIVDVLPILGTGTVLIPWAIFAFVSSDIRLGIGLLVLYGVTLVVRQLVEPKIVGSTLGIHPLLTLASVYIGLELLGFIGIFAGPLVALFITDATGGSKNTAK